MSYVKCEQTDKNGFWVIYHHLVARGVEDNISMLLLCVIYLSSLSNRHYLLADGTTAFLNIENSDNKSMSLQLRKLR